MSDPPQVTGHDRAEGAGATEGVAPAVWTAMWRGLQTWLEPIALGDAGFILAAFLIMLMLPGSWVNADRLEGPVIVLAMIALTLTTRRLLAIVPGFAAVALVTRTCRALRRRSVWGRAPCRAAPKALPWPDSMRTS